MSSFFTAPASQRKRKRSVKEDNQDGRRKRTDTRRPVARPTSRTGTSHRINGEEDPDEDDDDDGDSISSGDVSSHTIIEDSSSGEEDEDPAGRRTRLAERYLENTRQQVLAEGFDAEDIDREILAQRMGERLDEDTAEGKGKLYRWIANDYDLSQARQARFRTDANVVTSVAVCYPFLYTVAKDSSLTKWDMSSHDHDSLSGNDEKAALKKPDRVKSTRGNKLQDTRGNVQRHKGPILCVAASDDGRFVATGGQDKTIIIWDTAGLKPLKVFPQHRDSIIALRFRKGTNQLFSASKDRTIKMWSLNELAYVESLFGHQDAILDIDALSQETCVSVGARDKTARFWRVVEETQLVFRGGGVTKGAKGESDEQVKQYGEGSIERVAMIDNETFVTGADNGSLSLWSIQKKKAVFTYPLAHGVEPKLRPDEASAEAEPDSKCVPEQSPRWVTALRAVPLSNLFVTGSWDGHIRAWKISEDKRRIEPLGPLTIAGADGADGVNGVTGDHTNGETNSLVLAADGRGPDVKPTAKGVVNDLAIFETGDKGRGDLFVAAAVGKEHRLGRWLKYDGGRNQGVLYHLPRRHKQVDGGVEIDAQ